MNNVKNITLRALELSDAEMLMLMNNDEEIANCVVGNPKKVTMEEQLSWMEKRKFERGTIRFIIDYFNQSVGTIIISDISQENRTGNVNIKILSEYRGYGIGKLALKKALIYCFETLKLNCVTAHVLIDNLASQALFETIGFKKEGVLRSRAIKKGIIKDLISYSILSTEYKQ